MVVFPAPVGPVMANNPDSVNGASSKRIICSPFKEFKFKNLILKIFIKTFPFVPFVLLFHQKFAANRCNLLQQNPIRIFL